MIWKDRIKQYPHRYTLTNVSGSTYDFAEVTGEVIEAGTPVNAENLNKLIQRDGDDIKDTVTTFAEAGTRENIATGEKTSTIFGKIKKWLADLKPHAFNDLATVQGTETDKAPTNKLLTDSTCAAFYRNLTDPRLGLTTTSDMIALATAMIDFSILEATVTSAYTNILPPVPVCKLRVEKHSVNRISAFATYKDSNVTTQYYFIGHIKLGDTSSQWSGWEKILTNKVISTVMPISSAAASN
ncbi:MAG: hypothetical protein EOM87_05245, partial [Clostridia bacterium]|nr:hypothetical protein [Clostridia bacterium]